MVSLYCKGRSLDGFLVLICDRLSGNTLEGRSLCTKSPQFELCRLLRPNRLTVGRFIAVECRLIEDASSER